MTKSFCEEPNIVHDFENGLVHLIIRAINCPELAVFTTISHDQISRYVTDKLYQPIPMAAGLATHDDENCVFESFVLSLFYQNSSEALVEARLVRTGERIPNVSEPTFCFQTHALMVILAEQIENWFLLEDS